jgi:hypothetical protein
LKNTATKYLLIKNNLLIKLKINADIEAIALARASTNHLILITEIRGI